MSNQNPLKGNEYNVMWFSYKATWPTLMKLALSLKAYSISKATL